MAATTYYLSAISLIVQYLNNLGLMAAGGSVQTYLGGSSVTPVTTYTDSTGTVANPNPMTLSSTGRPAAANGAPVAFWVAGGTNVRLLVYDAAGNLLVYLDNVPAINDLTATNNALQTLLASPASSNASGTGPVAGADLVANAVKSYDVFADVRVANVPVMASGQTLNVQVQGGSTVLDGLGGTFTWSPTSTAADDGMTVLKPQGLGNAQPGRYLRNYERGVPVVIVKPSNQQVVSSTVLVNDTSLTLNLASGGTYLVQFRLQLFANGGTGQGYKVQLNFGGTLSGINGGGGVQSANGVASALFVNFGTAVTAAAISATTGDVFNADFVVEVSNGGALQVQFAQNSSSANATIMSAGSLITATRVA